jgi:DNA-binding GntR family transcriptional regulator
MLIERESVTDRVVAELRRQIIAGTLPAGTALRQDWLATKLGVSRIPIREAIRQLEAEGLVVSETHKGTIVSSLSCDELQELFEIRHQLETWLFGLAIPRMSEADFDHAAQLTREAAADGRVATWSELNWRFHEALYQPAKRLQALRILRQVHNNASRYVGLMLAVSGDVTLELQDHWRLLEAARAGDIEGGVALLGGHIQRVGRAVEEAIRTR